MRIIGIHSKHDASVCLIQDGKLVFCLEAEKDSNPRYCELSEQRLQTFLTYIGYPPDVYAFTGWHANDNNSAGYQGLSDIRSSSCVSGSRRFRRFSSSHERAHLLAAYGLSKYQQGEPCYALIWEGTIGSFYEITSALEIRRLTTPIKEPGHKYAFLFELADPNAPITSRGYSYDAAGKLMALAAHSLRSDFTREGMILIDTILNQLGITILSKKALLTSPYANIGVTHPSFKELAGIFSDIIFERFFKALKSLVKEKRPLLIGGGCGLNCDWNRKWKECGLFSDVFIPPCTNDSGVAIGTAIDAQFFYTGHAKLEWSVYSGEEFVHDVDVPGNGFIESELRYDTLAKCLDAGCIIAWVNGKCEIGPRSLGNRTILAAPFKLSTKTRLNMIKEREDYRPIAPVCIEEDVKTWFDWSGETAHMLFLVHVRHKKLLQAITHVDGTARLQTVRREQNSHLYDLLKAFKDQTGCGILCNTSLNWKGKGFINRMTDLVAFVVDKQLDGFTAGNRLYLKRPPP